MKLMKLSLGFLVTDLFQLLQNVISKYGTYVNRWPEIILSFALIRE